MTDRPDIVFAPLGAEPEATCVAFAADELALGSRLKELNTRSGGAVLKAAEAVDFKGKAKSAIEILAAPRSAPSGSCWSGPAARRISPRPTASRSAATRSGR